MMFLKTFSAMKFRSILLKTSINKGLQRGKLYNRYKVKGKGDSDGV